MIITRKVKRILGLFVLPLAYTLALFTLYGFLEQALIEPHKFGLPIDYDAYHTAMFLFFLGALAFPIIWKEDNLDWFVALPFIASLYFLGTVVEDYSYIALAGYQLTPSQVTWFTDWVQIGQYYLPTWYVWYLFAFTLLFTVSLFAYFKKRTIKRRLKL